MNARNPAYNEFGTVDLEIEHPTLGWIPFTANPNDPEVIGSVLHDRAIAGEFGTVAAYVPPTPPTSQELLDAERAAMVCSRFQAKAALEAAGLLAQAEIVVAAADGFSQLAWSEAAEFRRFSPTMLALAPALGLDDAALDDLFRAAIQIEA